MIATSPASKPRGWVLDRCPEICASRSAMVVVVAGVGEGRSWGRPALPATVINTERLLAGNHAKPDPRPSANHPWVRRKDIIKHGIYKSRRNSLQMIQTRRGDHGSLVRGTGAWCMMCGPATEQTWGEKNSTCIAPDVVDALTCHYIVVICHYRWVLVYHS